MKTFEAQIWERQVIWERVTVTFEAEDKEDALEQLNNEREYLIECEYHDTLETIYDDADALSYKKEYVEDTLEEIEGYKNGKCRKENCKS